IFVFAASGQIGLPSAPESPETPLPGLETPASPVATAATLPEAPLVLVVTLEAATLSEAQAGTSGTGESRSGGLLLAGTTAAADARTTGNSGEEEPAPGDAVALREGTSDVSPSLDEALRGLDLYRPTPGPGAPMSRGPTREGDELWETLLVDVRG